MGTQETAWDRDHTEMPNDKAELGLPDLLLLQLKSSPLGGALPFLQTSKAGAAPGSEFLLLLLHRFPL